MISRRHLGLMALSFAVLTGCALDPERVTIPKDTKLIVLRHADRNGEELSREGIARAKALVDALEGVHIDAIYSPNIQRNLDTAAPLAEARSLSVTRIPYDNIARRLVDGSEGKTIVWVGNKGNLADIWESLNAEDPAPLEYGDLFTVERGTLGGVTVTRARFGK